MSTNLERAFPDKSKTERIRIEKRFYKHLCDVFFETIKSLTISGTQIDKRFIIKNSKMIEELYAQNRSVILYAAHYGNWEWLGFLPLFIPYQASAFYQKLSNKYFDDLMQLIRSRFGVICFESKDGYKKLVKLGNEKKPTFNYIIGDQSPTNNSSKHWVKFLNQETAFLVGADRIAKKLNNVIIFPTFLKHKRGKYELEFSFVTSTPNGTVSSEVIEAYSRMLEESILKSPELWLWSHRRWKLTKTNM